MRRCRRNHFGTATDTNLDGDPPVLSMPAAAAVMAHPVEQCGGRSLWLALAVPFREGGTPAGAEDRAARMTTVSVRMGSEDPSA
jgi:hypothetical protein